MTGVAVYQVVGVGGNGAVKDAVADVTALNYFCQAQRFNEFGGVLK